MSCSAFFFLKQIHPEDRWRCYLIDFNSLFSISVLQTEILTHCNVWKNGQISSNGQHEKVFNSLHKLNVSTVNFIENY
jgi:hypothetical protein